LGLTHTVWVRGLPAWCEPLRLLGPGDWVIEGRTANARLTTFAAADLDARLRGVGIGGSTLEVTVTPPLGRPAVRAARTTDARRRRDTSPGFTRPGAQLDEEGRYSLTPEALALALGQRAAGRTVVDAGCGAGGNAIGFARAGCQVVAIERDAGRLAAARHNARLHGVEDRIRFQTGDAARLLPGLRADLLFLDPPWGVEWNRLHTPLDALPALPPLLAVSKHFPEVWVKLPPSFDVSTLPAARPEAWYGTAKGDERRVKFLLLRWRNAPAD
jgi:SAM-dependent methyltransferase